MVLDVVWLSLKIGEHSPILSPFIILKYNCRYNRLGRSWEEGGLRWNSSPSHWQLFYTIATFHCLLKVSFPPFPCSSGKQEIKWTQHKMKRAVLPRPIDVESCPFGGIEKITGLRAEMPDWNRANTVVTDTCVKPWNHHCFRDRRSEMAEASLCSVGV